MPHPTHSLYALAPTSQKVRVVVQVTPDGWSPDELEKMLAGFIPVLASAGIPLAVLVSQQTAFVVRLDEKALHFDIDEIEPNEVIAPYTLDPDPAKLFETVSRWVHQLVAHPGDFVPETRLPKRVPEIVSLLAGAKLRERKGSIGVPDDMLVENKDG